MATNDLHDTIDAAIWAAEFKRLFPDSDEGLMLGWFANAIMAGFDESARRAEAENGWLRAQRDEALALLKGWATWIRLGDIPAHVVFDMGARTRALLDGAEEVSDE